MYKQTIQPSRWYYGLGALIFFIGTALTASIIIIQFYRYFEEPKQILIPGEATLTFEKSGSYTIYYEYLSEYDGRIFDTGKAFIDIDTEIKKERTGSQLKLSRARLTFNRYIFGEHRDAIALLNFKVDKPGTYTITSSLENDSIDTEVVLSIAPNYIRIALVTFGWSFPLFILTVIISLLAVLITYFKRREFIRLRAYERQIFSPIRHITNIPQPWN